MFASYFRSKVTILLICSLSFFCTNRAMNNDDNVWKEKPSITTTPVPQYYTKNNLLQLYANQEQLHAPCKIIIDFDERVDTDFQAMMDVLYDDLKSPSYPIIVTSNLLKTVVQFTVNPELEEDDENNEKLEIKHARLVENFTKEKWSIYSSKNGNLLLLYPKNFGAGFRGLSFAFDQLKNLSNLLPTQKEAKNANKNYEPLENALKISNENSIDAQELKEFFYSKNSQKLLPLWDISIEGHGNLAKHGTYKPGVITKPAKIAGLSADNINDILQLFDQHIDTGVVYILTCYLGGENLNLLQTRKSGLKISHNFILIVGGTTDATIRGHETLEYIQFFNAAAHVSDGGVSLNNLMKSITKVGYPTVGEGGQPEAHGTPFIPQVWLPNGAGFQTLELRTFIYSIGKVKAQAAYENKKSLLINNKQEILVYPRSIEASVVIGVGNVANSRTLTQAKEAAWPQLPVITERLFWENTTIDEQFIFDSQRNTLLQQLTIKYPSLNKLTPTSIYPQLYPRIISMQKFPHVCIFKNITASGISAGFGIMRFLRDSFLDIVDRPITQTFYIEKLTGYNDISLLIEASQLVSRTTNPVIAALENSLKDKRDQNISLTNVCITTQFDPIKEKPFFALVFNLPDGTAWRLQSAKLATAPQALGWLAFEKIVSEGPKESLEKAKAYIGVLPDQKMISPTLKEKQLDIAKQPLIKKAEAAQIPRAQRLKLIKEDAMKHALQAIANQDLIYFRNALDNGVDLGNQQDMKQLKDAIHGSTIPHKSAYLEALLGKSKGQ